MVTMKGFKGGGERRPRWEKANEGLTQCSGRERGERWERFREIEDQMHVLLGKQEPAD